MDFTGHSGSADRDVVKWREAMRQRGRPDNEIPVTVGTTILLGRTDEFAVAVSSLRVYRNGVEFTVSARCRGRLARRGDLHAGLSGTGRLRQDAAERFLLGFEFSDGRRVSNLAGWASRPPDLDENDPGPWLRNAGGGGSGRSADHDFFLAPLPPGDTMTLIAAWPGTGLEESRHLIDAAALRTAAERVSELWPAEPDRVADREPPPPPVLPPGSWFGR